MNSKVSTTFLFGEGRGAGSGAAQEQMSQVEKSIAEKLLNKRSSLGNAM